MGTRKGVAPVVATIILVLIVIVAAGGAFAWISDVIQGQIDEGGEELAREVTVRDVQCAPAAGPPGNTSIDYLLVNTGDIDVDANSVNVYVYNVSNGNLWGTATGQNLGAFEAGTQLNSITGGDSSVVVQGATVQPTESYDIRFEFMNEGGLIKRQTCEAG